jgi:predicted aspartyl protease
VPIGLASFELAPEPLVLVDATLNGTGPFRFLIDTGSSTVSIATHVAEMSGVVVQSPDLAGYSGVGGDYTFRNGRVRSLEVAGREVQELSVSVAPLGDLAETVGTAVDGILGYPFLSRFRLTIDYAASEIELGESGAAAPHAIGFELRKGFAPVVIVPTLVGDTGPLSFVLDTGSSIMGVAEPAARALALPLRQERRAGYGDPAEFPHWWTDLGHIAVGGAAAERLEAIVYDMSRFEQAIGPPFDGIIGHPFLVAQGCVTIDYIASTVLLGRSA